MMTTPAANLPISFSNDDAKASICSKTQSSLNALVALVKTIIKTSHTNDYLTATLKQFSSLDQQILSTEEHMNNIEHSCQHLIFQSNVLQLDTQELVSIEQVLRSMKLDDQ